MEISENLRLRYARQIAVPEIGKEGQLKLRDSKVFIVGSGALGSMIAMQLAGAGIGEIAVIDYDTIEISNLQRQFFFTTEEAGLSKAEVLGKRLSGLNPEVKVHVFNGLLNKVKALEIFGNYDFIIDATDNPESKKITGEISFEKGKPCCIGGVKDFGGQVLTFLPQDPRFEDYFGNASAEGFLPCSLSGVMGPAAALCASVQASECIKYLTGSGDLLSGKLFLFDLSKNYFQTFSL